MKNVLILGIGNLVLNDEGIGIHIIHMLKSIGMPDGVDVLDGGLGSVDLLDTMQQYKHLILIDAAVDEYPAGTVRRLSPIYPADYPRLLYAHEQCVRDMVCAMQSQQDMPHVEMLAISVNRNPTLGMQLSPEVRRVIPQVLQLIFEILDDTQQKRYYR